MIITIKGADFSTKNIGTLSTWTIFTNLGSGATYSGNRIVDKNSSLSATITIADGYELGSAGLSVIMGTTDVTSSAATVNGNIITINIATVTGNVTIKVPTINTATGEEDGEDEEELAGTWVINENADISSFGGVDTQSLGTVFSGYTGYKVNFKFSPAYGGIVGGQYLIKSNNGVIFGYSRDGSSASGLWDSNSGWYGTFNRTFVIESTLSEVEGGENLLTWLNANAVRQ